MWGLEALQLLRLLGPARYVETAAMYDLMFHIRTRFMPTVMEKMASEDEKFQKITWEYQITPVVACSDHSSCASLRRLQNFVRFLDAHCSHYINFYSNTVCS